ncbi:MFS transporter [Sphingomonas leidyi]|uniref:MFS transporter n=2 Tax=Sphingomonadaceae TaxID=41297 RepID=UPI000B22491F|nr:MFS transporter [Sphingomonas sp.]
MQSDMSRESRTSLAALIVIGTGAMTSATLSPVMLGLYIDELRLTASQASLALAAENGAYALGLLLFYLVLHRARRPMLAAIGLAVMIVTSLLTARAGGFVPLLAIRAAFGLAMGFTASTVFAAYAGRADPQRVWAIATFVNLAYAALLLALSGWIAQTFGLTGIVAILAVVAAIGLACTRLIPPPPRPAQEAHAGPIARGLTINVPASCGALALLCLYAGHTTLWSFQERMGLTIGLDRSQVGVLLGISVLGAIAGALLSMAAGHRFGQRGPNALAFAGLIASALLLAMPLMAAYVAGAIIVKTAWFFGLPFILGALARLDRSGRWSSMGAALLALGSAIGPAIGATLAGYGAHMIGFLAAGLYLMSFLFTVPLFAADRSAAPR